ncbi:MAG: hypothetical protein HYX69_08830 [Planctomycetia bacterium]|nr:hypothetical protein [Planctomycetia bacterium]
MNQQSCTALHGSRKCHLMDYDVQRFTRRCAATGRELAEGEEFYTALVADGAALRRLDYAASAWHGPPEGALGWWKSRVPSRDARRPRLAPNEVLLELFVNLEGIADKEDMRTVMALLLVRRRVLRLEDTETDDAGGEVMVLYAPREDATYRVKSVMPSDKRVQEIQDELSRLLFAGAT